MTDSQSCQGPELTPLTLIHADYAYYRERKNNQADYGFQLD
jgi:hypothetical protein